MGWRAVAQGLVVALLTAASLEGAARLAGRSPTLRATLAGDLDGRRAASVLAALEGVDTTDPAGPGLAALGRRVVHDTELGWRNAPGVWPVAGVDTTVDADGHRAVPPAGADAPTVLLLGDSFTFGDEVGDADTWAWSVATATGAAVINAGTPSWGLDQVVLGLERELTRTRPDRVILGVSPASVTRTVVTWDAWAKPWFDVDDGALVPHGVPVPAPADVLGDGRLSHGRLLGGVLLAQLSRRVWPPDAEARAGALLDRAAHDVGAVPITVVWLPDPADLHAAGAPRRAWDAWCARHGASCLDTTDALAAGADAGVELRRGVHYTPAANALVAEAVTRRIQATPRPPR